MDYTSIFTLMRAEVTLTAILVFVFLYDLMAGERARRRFSAVVCCLMVVQVVVNLVPAAGGELFGGMFCHTPMDGIVKSMLSVGALIVFLQSDTWLRREDTRHKQGEFYILTLSTLLGMYFMIGAGNFLLFFIGLELASVPMACLVAFDKYKRYSAEAGAKYILCALFSSGLMLYGISFIYGACGTLYFDDVVMRLSATPMVIVGLVFFVSGLGFKISLVPFHFWTADSYQGAPTTVTGYLSVISKGAAAFTLCTVLMKVFGPMVEYWQYMLFIVIVLSITVANLFAIHQSDLKRFMAFSSISQAGYIVLAIVGNQATSVYALSFYVLIYVVANMAVFTIISSIEEHNNGVVDMESYNGLYQTNPRLAFLMTLALFSLGGIPPFAGMFSKFFVFMAAVKGADLATTTGALAYIVVFIALVNTVISLYYYLLIVKAMYIKPNEHPLPTFQSATSTKLALAVCTTGVLLFGVCSFIYEWIALA